MKSPFHTFERTFNTFERPFHTFERTFSTLERRFQYCIVTSFSLLLQIFPPISLEKDRQYLGIPSPTFIAHSLFSCIFASSYADRSVSQGTERRGGQDILKGVYYALVLTFWNPRKISRYVSKTKVAVNAPWVCYRQPSLCPTAIGVSLRQWFFGYWGCIYTYRRGASALLVSTHRGQ